MKQQGGRFIRTIKREACWLILPEDTRPGRHTASRRAECYTFRTGLMVLDSLRPGSTERSLP
jgi:hypothetical protein